MGWGDHLVLQALSEVALTGYSEDKGSPLKEHVVMSFESSKAYLYSVALLVFLVVGELVSFAYSKIGLSA